MKLKVCGLKYPGNIYAVSELLPDYMGFIFWPQSSRYFEGEIPNLPNSVEKVGVFVDATIADIKAKIEKYDLHAIQLHGHESPEFCAALQNENVKVIKAFAITETSDLDPVAQYESCCDYFLFDTKGKLPGGNGAVFNWKILKKYSSNKPFFLSGGIGPNEIREIKKLKIPIYAIDVNSKFEIKPGLKNTALLRMFQDQLKS